MLPTPDLSLAWAWTVDIRAGQGKGRWRGCGCHGNDASGSLEAAGEGKERVPPSSLASFFLFRPSLFKRSSLGCFVFSTSEAGVGRGGCGVGRHSGVQSWPVQPPHMHLLHAPTPYPASQFSEPLILPSIHILPVPACLWSTDPCLLPGSPPPPPRALLSRPVLGEWV